MDILKKVDEKESHTIDKSPKITKKKNEEKIVKVVSEETYSVFLTLLGKVYPAGQNVFQQLGMEKRIPTICAR